VTAGGNGALYPSPAELAGQVLGWLPLPHGPIAAGLDGAVGTRGRLGKVAAYTARVVATGSIGVNDTERSSI
jgi:hypothetical protein